MLFLIRKISLLFIFFMLPVHGLSQEAEFFDPTAKVKEIGKSFEWNDLEDKISRMQSGNAIDELSSHILLIYHELRLQNRPAIFSHLEAISTFPISLFNDLESHELYPTLSKIIYVAISDPETAPYIDVNHEEFKSFNLMVPENSIERWLACSMERFGIETELDPKSDCTLYFQHLTALREAEEITPSNDSKETDELLSALIDYFAKANGVYEKIDIAQVLVMASATSKNYEKLLQGTSLLTNLMKENEIKDRDLQLINLLALESVKGVWETNIDSDKTNFFIQYLDQTNDKNEFLNQLDDIALSLFVRGILHEEGLESKTYLEAINILEKKWKNYLNKNHDDFSVLNELPLWSSAVATLSNHYLEVEKDQTKSINVLADFIRIYEKSITTENIQFLDKFFALLKDEKNFDWVIEQVFGANARVIGDNPNNLISDAYANYALRLDVLGERAEEALQNYYKAMFLLSVEQRSKSSKSLELLPKLASLHFETKFETISERKLRKYYAKKTIETAKEFLLQNQDGNIIRLFETFTAGRDALENSIFELKFSIIDALLAEDFITQLTVQDTIYDAIQLLRMNRVSLMYSADTTDLNKKILNLNKQRFNVEKLLTNKAQNLSLNRTEKISINSELQSLTYIQQFIPHDTAVIIAFDGGFKTNFAFLGQDFFYPEAAEINISDLTLKKNKIIASVKFNQQYQSIPQFDYESSAWIYNKIFRSTFAEDFFKDKKNIIFLPSKSLYNFPLTLLHSGTKKLTDGSNQSNYDPNQFLIDNFNLAHMVELNEQIVKSIFKKPLTQTANYQVPKAKTFLGIANPAYGSTLTADLRGLNFVELEPITQPAYQFTQLPETIDEVESVATNFKDGSYKILSGKNANKTVLNEQNLSSYDIIMFSTHGISPGDINGFEDTAIVLSSGFKEPQETVLENMLLTSNDILGFELNAELVILNACSSGIPNLQNAPGLTGLGQSFLVSGAKSIMVSHWEIETHATKMITQKMFEIIKKNNKASYNFGLVNAQRYLKSQDATSHPFYWAAFTIYNNF